MQYPSSGSAQEAVETSQGRLSTTRTLGWLATFGLAAFPVLVVILQVLQRDRYNPFTQPMSQLALDRTGWLMEVAFGAYGAGLLLLAVTLLRTVSRARVLAVLLTVAGLTNFVAAAFHTDATGAAVSTHGLVHNLGGLLGFALQPAALLIAGLMFRTRPAWRAISRPTIVWSAIAIVAFVAMFVLAALNLFGLGQRLALGVTTAWLIVLALRAPSVDDVAGAPASISL